MSLTQVPLSGAEAAVIGVGALIAVTLDLTWALVVYGMLMAHEGAHGAIGSVFFHRVSGVRLEGNATGSTGVKSARGMRGHIFYFVGYLGPSLFGLGAAKLIEAGHIVAVVWVTIFLLGVLLMWVVNLWGRFTVLLIGGLVYAAGHHTPMPDQVIAAYAITWLLLLSGVRQAFAHGTGAKDAEILRDRTAIPRFIWALVWIAGTLGAGGVMLQSGDVTEALLAALMIRHLVPGEDRERRLGFLHRRCTCNSATSRGRPSLKLPTAERWSLLSMPS